MTHLKFSPSESTRQSMAFNVALFEALCTEKRELGAQIEKDILQIDRSALEEVRAATFELERARFEYAAVTTYLDNAYKGFLKKITGEPILSRNGFPSSILSTPINYSNSITTNSLASLPLSSSASAVPDTASFSVTSETIHMIEEDINTDITDSDSCTFDTPVDFLASVERHRLLCQALHKLDSKIRDEAERPVLIASNKVANANNRLETSRKEAAETIEGLRQASGNAISVELPWVSSSGDYATSAADTVSMVATDDSLDAPVITSVDTTFHPSSPPPPHITVCDIPDHQIASSVNDARNSSIKVPFIYPNEDIFPRYEAMMTSITTRGSPALRPRDIPWPIPWPVLTLSTHDYPPKTRDPLMASDALNDNLEVFVLSYARWKGQYLCQTRSAMRLDWTVIRDRIPVWMREQRAKVEHVLSFLSDPL